MKKSVTIFLILLAAGILLVFFLSLREGVELTETPTRIPAREEIVPVGTTVNDILRTSDETRIPELMQPTPFVQQATSKLLSASCEHGTETCKLQAIYDFVRLNYEYTERSPEHAYIQSPTETLLYNSGDALELALVMASMQRAAGFQNDILVGPYHTFVRVHEGNHTIILDPSCPGCKFNDVRVDTSGRERVFS